MDIVGLSFNTPAKNKAWSEHEQFPFEVWSDVDKTLALTYGAVSSRLLPVPSRMTVVLGSDGQVLLAYTEGIKVGTHPADVLADCKALFGKESAQ